MKTLLAASFLALFMVAIPAMIARPAATVAAPQLLAFDVDLDRGVSALSAPHVAHGDALRRSGADAEERQALSSLYTPSEDFLVRNWDA
jgi:hypothetical protein